MGNIGIAASAIVQPLELMLTMYTSVGLSGGAVSFISPALGRQDLKTAQKYLMHYMFIYLVFIVLVPLCTLPWLPTLVLLLGAPENSDLQKYAIQYGTISFSLATVFYFINYGFGNILRAYLTALSKQSPPAQSYFFIIFFITELLPRVTFSCTPMHLRQFQPMRYRHLLLFACLSRSKSFLSVFNSNFQLVGGGHSVSGLCLRLFISRFRTGQLNFKSHL
ncbi:Na+_driven multidrug efflux pump [Hexamita inflata]|uniref:Na+ driven multidrug efflux pump n=1 Tax=Hexamita inflata TaxID=28002 RepID=A0AA86QAU2_9EUKA|nr:Na+ driven multidrug efflux pump [Hexamita inflata]